MMSILSNSQAYRNNSMTIIKGNRGGLSSLGHNTTIYGEESLAENGEIEEMHYLMVRVERIKKQMLANVEGTRKTAKSALGKVTDIDMREDMLYENDVIIEVGGDVPDASIRDESNVNLTAEHNVEKK